MQVSDIKSTSVVLEEVTVADEINTNNVGFSSLGSVREELLVYDGVSEETLEVIVDSIPSALKAVEIYDKNQDSIF